MAAAGAICAEVIPLFVERIDRLQSDEPEAFGDADVSEFLFVYRLVFDRRPVRGQRQHWSARASDFSQSTRRFAQRARPKRDEPTHETCYAPPMFGLFNLFGQSAALNALDDALRASGVHPVLVPDAVKLTVLRLQKEGLAAGTRTREAACSESAQLFAYCMLGRAAFIDSTGVPAADRAEDRLEAAIATGDSLDAKLILLALHSGLIAPDIADRIEVGGE